MNRGLLLCVLLTGCVELPGDPRPVSDEARGIAGPTTERCTDGIEEVLVVELEGREFRDVCVWCHPDDEYDGCTDGYRPGYSDGCFVPNKRVSGAWLFTGKSHVIVMARGHESFALEAHELGHYYEYCEGRGFDYHEAR